MDESLLFDKTDIAIECAVMIIFYRIVFFNFLGAILKWLYSTRPWWPYLASYRGLFVKNTQLEMVYVTVLGIHHIAGGLVMLYAYYYDVPRLYAHACVWELVDDIHDMACMVLVLWPFDERDMKMIFIMGVHHTVGFIIVVPALTTGLYLNPHMQMAGLALLLAGGVSCFSVAGSRTLDRRVPSEAWLDFYFAMVSTSFYVVCRFYIFPKEAFLFLQEKDIAEGVLRYEIYIAIGFMLFFNVLIFIEAFKAVIIRFGIALAGGEKRRPRKQR